jgi:hypothetical protein
MGRNGSRKPVLEKILVLVIILVLIVVQDDNPPPPSIISPCFSSLKPCEDHGSHRNIKRCNERCKRTCAGFRTEHIYRGCVGGCKAQCLKGGLRSQYSMNFSI